MTSHMRCLALTLLLSAPVLAQPVAPDDPGTWTQTAQGVRLLDGSASLARIDEATLLSVSPRIGQFVVDRLAISAALALSGQWRSDTVLLGSEIVEASSSSFSAGIGPTITYYGGPIAGRSLRPFAEAGAQISYIRLRTESSLGGEFTDSRVSASRVSAGLNGAAGVAFPVARNVAVRAQAFVNLPDVDDTDFVFYGLSAGFTTFIY